MSVCLKRDKRRGKYVPYVLLSKNHSEGGTLYLELVLLFFCPSILRLFPFYHSPIFAHMLTLTNNCYMKNQKCLCLKKVDS